MTPPALLLWGLSVWGYYRWGMANATHPSYITWISVPFELLSFAVLMLVSLCLAEHGSSLLEDVGKNSYILYFTHMQIGMNIINLAFFRIWDRSDVIGCLMVPIRPVLVVGVSYFLFVVLGKRIARRLKLEKLLWIVGL